jgi:hypothetical protein
MTRQWIIPATVSLFTVSGLLACSSGSSNTTEGVPDAAAGGDTGSTIVIPDASSPVADATQPTADAGATFDAAPPSVDASTAYDALPAPPQVVNDNGGVLTSPAIVAIFFSNEDVTELPSFESFYSGIGTSAYWQALTEYGIGAATVTNVVLTQAAPTTIDDGGNSYPTALEKWLLAEIANGDLPAPTANTEYMINYPSGTTVTSDGTQCQDFDGYHSDIEDSSNNLIAYGVIPRCKDPGSTILNTFGSTVSHELIEAATDPYPDYQPGWPQADNKHLFWDEANDGSEIGDMCENDPEAYHQFSDFPFTVQRFWSNKSALAGHDPCVPEIPGAVFFNAVPELNTTGLFDYYGTDAHVSSVSIAKGATGTVYLDLYSDGSLANWDVTAYDYNYFFTGSGALLTLDMPVTKGNNRSRLALNITVNDVGNANTNGQIDNTELFVIQSSQGTSEKSPAHFWYGIVTN